MKGLSDHINTVMLGGWESWPRLVNKDIFHFISLPEDAFQFSVVVKDLSLLNIMANQIFSLLT